MTNIIEVKDLTEEIVNHSIPVFVKTFNNKKVYFEIALYYKEPYHITFVNDEEVYAYNTFEYLSEAVEFFNNIKDD